MENLANVNFSISTYPTMEYYDETSVNIINPLAIKKVKGLDNAIFEAIKYANKFKNKGLYQVTLLEALTPDIDNRYSKTIYHKTNSKEFSIFEYPITHLKKKTKYNMKDKVSEYSYPINENFIYYPQVKNLLAKDSLIKQKNAQRKLEIKNTKGISSRELYLKYLGDFRNLETPILKVFKSIEYPKEFNTDDAKELYEILQVCASFSKIIGTLINKDVMKLTNLNELCIKRKDTLVSNAVANYSIEENKITFIMNKKLKSKTDKGFLFLAIMHEFGHCIDYNVVNKSLNSERKLLITDLRRTEAVKQLRNFKKESKNNYQINYYTYRLKGIELFADSFSYMMLKKCKININSNLNTSDYSEVMENFLKRYKILN